MNEEAATVVNNTGVDARAAESSVHRPPLRVVQSGFTQGGGGMENVIPMLSCALARAGHDVLLLTDGERWLDTVRAAGVECHVVDLHHRSLSRLLSGARQIRGHLSRFRPDVVHVHARSQALAFALAGRRPDWFTLHSSKLTHSFSRWDSGFLRRHVIPTGRNVFVICEEAVEFATEHLGYAPERVFMVPNGVDCDRFQPPTPEAREHARREFGVGPADILAVFVGRFQDVKQPEHIIDLASAARDAGLEHVRFALVGAGPLEEPLRKAIQEKDLADRCSIHGWMADPRMAYWAADVYLLPSAYEGFGLAPAEALACGCPVLRTRTGGWKSMIVEDETGFVSEIDRDSFVEVGLRMLRESQKLATMRAAARDHAVANLSMERQVTSTVEAYRNVMDRKRGWRSGGSNG